MSERKFPLSIWLRQPARKIRMASVTADELNSLYEVVGTKGKVHGPTKAGMFVIIPTDNIAYIEADALEKTDAEES